MPNVLLVEDDADSREVMTRALTHAGYDVRAVANGREALDEVLRADADAIVLDVRMPVMDGVEFMKVVRSYLRFQNVPVIVVTAITDGIELERVRAHGVARVFIKASFDLAEFVTFVGQLAGEASPHVPPFAPPAPPAQRPHLS